MSRGHEVAILLGDLAIAQALSNTIRTTGVIPHFYDDLKSFWFGSIENPSSILIVDVMQMSQGELSLCDHPLLRDRSMQLIVYYTSNTAPLLQSAYDLSPLGMINGDFAIPGQMKVILERYNQQIQWQQNSLSANRKNSALVKELSDVQAQLSQKDMTQKAQDQLVQLCHDLQRSSKTRQFFELCEQVFSKCDFIQHYAMVELAPGEQRAVTHKGKDSKIVEFSQLWLGKKCENGLELFAQNLITQVALESFSSEIIILGIHSYRGNPDKLIFIQPTSEMLNALDWDLLENHLSGIYSRQELMRERLGQKTVKEVDPWIMMEIADREFFSLTEDQGEVKLVDLDFSNLLEAIRLRPDVRFFWDRFSQEFKHRLGLALDFEFQLSILGPRHLSIACQKAPHNWYEQIRHFADGFPYWRFFENIQVLGERELTPQLKMIPSSSEAYLNFLDRREVVYSRHSLQAEISQDSDEMEMPPVTSRVRQWSESRVTL